MPSFTVYIRGRQFTIDPLSDEGLALLAPPAMVFLVFVRCLELCGVTASMVGQFFKCVLPLVIMISFHWHYHTIEKEKYDTTKRISALQTELETTKSHLYRSEGAYHAELQALKKRALRERNLSTKTIAQQRERISVLKTELDSKKRYLYRSVEAPHAKIQALKRHAIRERNLSGRTIAQQREQIASLETAQQTIHRENEVRAAKWDSERSALDLELNKILDRYFEDSVRATVDLAGTKESHAKQVQELNTVIKTLESQAEGARNHITVLQGKTAKLLSEASYLFDSLQPLENEAEALREMISQKGEEHSEELERYCEEAKAQAIKQTERIRELEQELEAAEDLIEKLSVAGLSHGASTIDGDSEVLADGDGGDHEHRWREMIPGEEEVIGGR